MRGQISVEFMTLVSILIVIFTVFLWSANSWDYKIIGIKTNAEAKKLSDIIAFEINSAARAGDGYKRSFYLDEHPYGISDYDISVEGYSVFIDWDDKSISSNIITKNITGNVIKGWNLIENKDGMVYVN
jgi:hypothetical protein